MAESYADQLDRVIDENFQTYFDYRGHPEVQKMILDELMQADEAAGRLALAGVDQLPETD